MPEFMTGLFLAIVFVAIPAMAAASRRAMLHGLHIPKVPLYSQLIGTQVFLLVLALGTDATARLELRALFALPEPRSWGFAAMLLAGALLLMAVSWKWSSLGDRELMRMITPGNGDERLLWTVICGAAGLAEEITWRGVLPLILAQWTDNLWLIVALSAISFGLGHLMQGVGSAVVVTLFGAAFHLVVIAGESLWPAIVAHAIYDLVVGFMVGRAEHQKG